VNGESWKVGGKMSTENLCPECGQNALDELAEREADLCFACQGKITPPYFEARIKVALDPDILADSYSMGVRDSALAHEIEAEIKGHDIPSLIGINKIEFFDCVIRRGK